MKHKLSFPRNVGGLLLLCALLFVGCSKDDIIDPTNTGKSEKTENNEGSPFKVEMVEDFSRAPHKNFNNIEVKQWLYYNVFVTAPSKGDSLRYFLGLSNEISGRYHRRYGKDYVAYFLPKEDLIEIEKEPLLSNKLVKAYKLENPYCELTKAGEYCLILEPLQPGSFRHEYKFIAKNTVTQKEQTVTVANNFNCLQIECWVVNVNVGKKRRRADYYFRINAGTHELDKFLANREGRTMTYKIAYAGKIYDGSREGEEGVFEVDKNVLFHRGEAVSSYSIDDWSIEDVIVNIKDEHSPAIRVDFQNVPLRDKR